MSIPRCALDGCATSRPGARSSCCERSRRSSGSPGSASGTRSSTSRSPSCLDVVLEPFNVNRAALAAGRASLLHPELVETRRLANEAGPRACSPNGLREAGAAVPVAGELRPRRRRRGRHRPHRGPPAPRLPRARRQRVRPRTASSGSPRGRSRSWSGWRRSGRACGENCLPRGRLSLDFDAAGRVQCCSRRACRIRRTDLADPRTAPPRRRRGRSRGGRGRRAGGLREHDRADRRRLRARRGRQRLAASRGEAGRARRRPAAAHRQQRHLDDRRGQPADRRRPPARDRRDATPLQLRGLHLAPR